MGFFTRTMQIPAVWFLGIWIAMQMLSASIAKGGGGGVAWHAHIGGFIAGLALIGFFKRAEVPFFGGPRRYWD